MALSTGQSRRLLTATLLMLLAVSSLLPARWSGYGAALGHVTALMLAPLSVPLTAISRLRGNEAEAPPEAEHLLTRWEQAQQALQEISRLRVERNRLRLENRMLRNLKAQLGGEAEIYRFPAAGVIGVSADPYGATLRINRGSRSGLAIGQAVVEGADLVGRIAQTGTLTATVELITNRGLLLDAVVTEMLSPLQPEIDAQRICQFEAVDIDRLVGVVSTDYEVSVGQYARLMDSDWPAGAQGMIIGQVTDVKPLPDQPYLRKQIIIQPRRALRHLGEVTIVVRRTVEINQR
jgi:rod shape-determining protein MreC